MPAEPSPFHYRDSWILSHTPFGPGVPLPAMVNIQTMTAMRAPDPDTEAAVRAFLNRLPAHLRVERAILYGSRARGQHRSDSDADVAVILPDSANDWRTLWMLSGLAFNIFVETGILIQPVPISSKDWANPAGFARPSFIRNVAKEGIPL